MIVSHSKKFIFIHGRKTAGSSIGISLMRYLKEGDIVRGYITGGLNYEIYPPDWQFSLQYLMPQDLFHRNFRVRAYRRFVSKKHNVSSTHLGADQIKDLIGEKKWKEYYKFTFERNPFDRAISFYHWRVKNQLNPPSFKEFIVNLKSSNIDWLEEHNLDNFLNYPLYTIKNNIVIDRVYNFDNLYSDMNILCNKINIDYDGWLPRNKSGVRPKSTNINDYYDNESKKIIKNICKSEFDILNS